MRVAPGICSSQYMPSILIRSKAAIQCPHQARMDLKADVRNVHGNWVLQSDAFVQHILNNHNPCVRAEHSRWGPQL